MQGGSGRHGKTKRKSRENQFPNPDKTTGESKKEKISPGTSLKETKKEGGTLAKLVKNRFQGG